MFSNKLYIFLIVTFMPYFKLDSLLIVQILRMIDFRMADCWYGIHLLPIRFVLTNTLGSVYSMLYN